MRLWENVSLASVKWCDCCSTHFFFSPSASDTTVTSASSTRNPSNSSSQAHKHISHLHVKQETHAWTSLSQARGAHASWTSSVIQNIRNTFFISQFLTNVFFLLKEDWTNNFSKQDEQSIKLFQLQRMHGIANLSSLWQNCFTHICNEVPLVSKCLALIVPLNVNICFLKILSACRRWW